MSEEKSGRNILDVAMELTKIHLKTYGVADSDELKGVYADYYSLAKSLGARSGKSLSAFLPEEIKKKISE